MPKLRPKDVGKYRREYDTTDQFDEDAPTSLEELLAWAAEIQPELEVNDNSWFDKLKIEFSKMFFVQTQTEGSLFFGVQKAHSAVGLSGHAAQTIDEFFNSARDIASMQQVKTRATVISGMAAGALIGFVIGTLIFPGIGSILGGAAGASAVSLLELLGGVGGLVILGAVGGNRGASWVAKKVFKDEKHYEIRVKNTNRLKNKYGIDSKLAHLMNGYLYNRSKRMTNERCKQVYKNLRVLAIERGHPSAIDRMARFFANELVLLEKERPKKNNRAAYEHELQAVRSIVEALIQPGIKIHEDTKDKIQHILNENRRNGSPQQSSKVIDLNHEHAKLHKPHPIAIPKPIVVPVGKQPKGILVHHQNRQNSQQEVPLHQQDKHVRFSVGSHFSEYDNPQAEPLTLETVKSRVIQNKAILNQQTSHINIGEVTLEQNRLHVPVNNTTLTITQHDQDTDTGTYHNIIYDVSPDVSQNVHTHDFEKKEKAIEVLKVNFWFAMTASEPGTELAVGKSFQHIVNPDFIKQVLMAHRSELSDIKEKNLHVKCGQDTFSINHIISKMKVMPGRELR